MSLITCASVEKEYEKLNNVKQDDIRNLMAWLKGAAHLPHEYITELDVILAYHSCACDADLTKRVIDVNYTLKTLFPFYQNRKVDACLDMALQTWLIHPLPTLTKNGFRSIYCELLDADPKKFVYADVIKAFLMIMDLWQYEEGTVPGVALIVNLDRVSLGHISRVNLTVAQQFFYFLQEAMFVSLKEFHFINAPTFVDKLLSMVKPFMKDELLDILKVHQADANSLEEFIAVEDLVKDNKNVLKDEMFNKLKANHKFFEDEAKKRVDESKRPDGPKTLSSFFPGMEESFKKLEID
ncbi:alpha-tocopherol transfer protein-like [Spodoptera litura]|uniref:Alpha-tocopherol transfer protein-like n=1 Tax=Spodoptera litura TaxID=69820 RepID=A0A9J7EKJ1_SPOLT|nr:alpha-tocopherol transfer protein-like [Spodoptera litura]